MKNEGSDKKSVKNEGTEFEDLADIAQYYRKNGESGRLQTQQLEFAITKKVLDSYLKSPQNVLELGAGSGRYTQYLLEAGHKVTALDLTEELIDENRRRVSEFGSQVSFVVGDAREVRSLVPEKFDAILVMGPLYHLVKSDDRHKLMKDIEMLLSPNGKIFSSFLTRMGLMSYQLALFPEWLERVPEQAKEMMQSGFVKDHPRNGMFRGYFSSFEDVRSLHNVADLELEALHVTDPCIGAFDEIFNRLPERLKKKWADFLFDYSSDPVLLGSGRTLMAVGRKLPQEEAIKGDGAS